MKKGEKLLSRAYILQIKDIHNKTVGGGLCRSLRQAVTTAAEYVADMSSYQKVHREFTIMRGAYAGVFFAKYKSGAELLAVIGRKPTKHLFVLINQAVIPEIELQQDISDGPPEGILGELGELMSE